MVPSGLAMVLFAPVSGRMINRWGDRITLPTGSAVLGLSYLGRVFFSGSVGAVIAGSTTVSIGPAISYPAMPRPIIWAVPITETASANGLNSLLRAIGTSTRAAAVAAILGSVTLHVGTSTLPSFAAFQDVFWMAGLSARLACGIVSYIKPPVRGPATAGGKAERPRPTATVTEAGENTEFVVRRSILLFDDTPIHPAVITVMKSTAHRWTGAAPTTRVTTRSYSPAR